VSDTLTLEWHHERAGSLTALAAVPKLSDVLAGFGVKNTSTGAVIVADAQDMTASATTGVYTYGPLTVDTAEVTWAGAGDADGTLKDLTQYTFAVEYVEDDETHRAEFNFTTEDTSAGDSSLTLVWADFIAQVAAFLDIASSSTDVHDIVNRGYRQFLYPPRIGQEKIIHVWSFLNPNATVAVTATVEDYTLDEQFGGIRGEITYDDASLYQPVPVISEGQIMTLRARNPSSTGDPQFVAVRTKQIPSGTTTGQRHELLVWPTPDSSLTLNVPFNVQVNKLSATNTYPVGGSQHSETILASCLAVAEHSTGNTSGVERANFMERLAASIQNDRQTMAPKTLGYGAGQGTSGGATERPSAYTTYNGVQYP